MALRKEGVLALKDSKRPLNRFVLRQSLLTQNEGTPDHQRRKCNTTFKFLQKFFLDRLIYLVPGGVGANDNSSVVVQNI
jgi:hypothetical protein